MGHALACSTHSLRAPTLEPLELKFPASRTEAGNFCCYRNKCGFWVQKWGVM